MAELGRRLLRSAVIHEWAVGLARIPVEDWVAAAVRDGAPPDVPITWFAKPGVGRFVADPMLFVAGGEVLVAYEMFDPNQGRGSIGVGAVRRGAIRHMGTTIDDPAVHLAYPFVFEVDGELYCVPDRAPAEGMLAWRIGSATSWEPAGPLPGLPRLTDLTLHPLGDTWWAVGTTVVDGQESLHVFHSSHPFATWAACSAAPTPTGGLRRSAGPFVAVGDQLLRPSQNASNGYGTGLVLNQVRSLGPAGLEEVPVASLSARVEWPCPDGLHTLSGAAGWTVIDGFRRRRSWRAPSQKIRARRALRSRLAARSRRRLEEAADVGGQEVRPGGLPDLRL